ncbi:VOC family protein [Labrenzia sp. PHM005]|uniref:VOC family protein n=1 Tax=Labrenzia sp. PHM005 TaxID=2590016 RepID=UPI00113FF4E8|nr:VOC family protein [Labrenzia sp. PHM005]QDG77796.1 VOC family protein [Labrenzia sp. PHM005]
MVRGLDHVVMPVHDLEAAARAFEKLGFTVSPENRHSWGTANRLIQLDGFFLEILTVADDSLITDSEGSSFSFGGFNRDFLNKREGASMLVLDSSDPEEDRADFEKAGLSLFDPFSFGRIANRPDGSTAEVGFDLTFVGNAASPDIGYFTCRNKFPENFWQPVLQNHANGAQAIKAVYMIAEDPSDHHEFLGGFTGQREMRATSLGLELDTARGQISVLNPRAYRSLIGDDAANAMIGPLPQIAAIEIACTGVTERRVVPASQLFGLTLILSPAA